MLGRHQGTKWAKTPTLFELLLIGSIQRGQILNNKHNKYITQYGIRQGMLWGKKRAGDKWCGEWPAVFRVVVEECIMRMVTLSKDLRGVRGCAMQFLRKVFWWVQMLAEQCSAGSQEYLPVYGPRQLWRKLSWRDNRGLAISACVRILVLLCIS